MTPDIFFQKTERLEIEKYREPKDRLALSRNHVAFSGFLQKHPIDLQKVVLIPDPHNTKMTYIEFSREDIRYLEKLPGITNLRGETVNITRIWVKKSSIAVRCTPFMVDKPESIL